MTIGELVKNLKSIGTHDETELWETIEEAADKLEELVAEVKRLTNSRDGYAKHSIERGKECDHLKATLAEKDKEIAALRDRMEKAEASVSAEMDGMYGHDAGGTDG